jgi:hypothetical protein
MGAAGGAALLVVGVAVATVSWLNAHRFGPEAQARGYLDAVVAGDTDEVLDLAPLEGDARRALLDPEVYGAAQDRLTGYDVVDVERDGDTATVTVEVEGLEGSSRTTLDLRRAGSQKVLFDRWEVAGNGLVREVYLAAPEGAASVTVNGRALGETPPGGEAAYWALPGSYEVDPYADDPWIEGAATRTVVSADPYSSTYAELPEPEPSDALMDEVDAALDEWLAGCMASTELEPDDCPQSAYPWYDDVRDVEWELVDRPTLSASYFDGSFPMELSADDTGLARVTYEGRDSWLGDRRWDRESETSDLYVDATVDLVGDEVEVSFDSY